MRKQMTAGLAPWIVTIGSKRDVLPYGVGFRIYLARRFRGPRIGVDYAGLWAAEPLRFWDAASRHVSRKGKT